MITIITVGEDYGRHYFAFRNDDKTEREAKKADLLQRIKGWKEWTERKLQAEGASWNADKVIIRMQPVKYHWGWSVSVPVCGTGLEFTGIDPCGGQFVPGKWDIVVELKEGELVEGSYTEE